ncbi:MAG: hypothetical protein V7642_6664 [Burkholderiales bacterium]|jgi:hypothetical protein
MSTVVKMAGTGSGADTSLEFCIRLSRAYATLTRRLDNVLSGLHGLSFADFMILYYLERRQAPSCVELIWLSA